MPFILIPLLDVLRTIWSLRKDRGFVVLAISAILLVLAGSTFYWQVENLRPINAFYLTMTTLTTVGYGDVSPHTGAGKIFTAGFVVLGVGVLLALLASIAAELQRKSMLHRPLASLEAHRASRSDNGGDTPSGRTDLSAYGEFDVLVIGSNEASRETAVAAARAGLRVVVADGSWSDQAGSG